MTYGAHYYERHRYDVDPRRAVAYAQEAERVKSRVRKGSILDVGCGTGGFGAQFLDGWQVYGIEPDTYAAERAADKGIKIVDYGLLQPATFEAVIFRGSIQHIENPFEIIRIVTRLLLPDGWLVFLATPNANSAYYKLWSTLPCLDPPRNYWIPSDHTLKDVLTNCQYSAIEFFYPYKGGPYAQPIRDYAVFFGRLFGLKCHSPFPRNMMECYAHR